MKGKLGLEFRFQCQNKGSSTIYALTDARVNRVRNSFWEYKIRFEHL